MKTDSDRMLPTEEDEKAFKHALTRAIFPISSKISEIQKIDQSNKNCQSKNQCGNSADYTIERDSKNQFAQYLCVSCIEARIQEWHEEMIQNLKEDLKRYKTAKQL
jgi:hypothetical protein